MANLRLFVAIELPAGVLASLNKVQHELQRDPALARLRWTRPEGIHLTLSFLGTVPEERGGEVEAAVARAVVGVAPFDLGLGKLGTFGGKRAPRVLWVDVGCDRESLTRLHGQLGRELAPLGFPPEERAYSPHLTLARVPPEVSRDVAEPLANAVSTLAAPAGSFRAEELALMKSDLRPGGAVYTQLFAAALE
ncbi:MAG: RNA 2',3'-cyclic phosphodiesterase [Chloroflexota bacterium]